MNPNSQNQRWSRWTFTVKPVLWRPLIFESVRETCARFGRVTFGTASQMNVARDPVRCVWVVQVRTEGHPVHDPAFVQSMSTQWRLMFEHNFPQGCTVTVDAQLEAGSRQDGTPPDQLVMLPSIQSLLQGEQA